MNDISSLNGGFCIGNVKLTRAKLFALYCSQKVRGASVPECQELIMGLAQHGLVLASGWHSPLEKWLFQKTAPVKQSRFLYFMSKGIEHYRPDEVQEQLLQQGRMAVLSKRQRGKRISESYVQERDAWMREMIQRFLFCFVDPDGYTSTLIQECLNANKEVFVYNYPTNPYSQDNSVMPVDLDNYQEVLGLY